MKILAVDTSTSVLSVAILEDNKIIIEFNQNKALTHSEKLMPCIDYILKNSDTKIEDIDEFAVTVGPGSFTGIRIGVSVINSFAMIRNKKAIGISTLKTLAYNLKNFDGIIISTVYAQREDYYYNIYSAKNRIVTEIEEENAKSISEIFEIAKELSKENKVIFVGDICEKEEIKSDNIYFAKANDNYTRASNVCYLAKELLSEIEMPRFAVPVYIRKSQAEVQYDERKKENE